MGLSSVNRARKQSCWNLLLCSLWTPVLRFWLLFQFKVATWSFGTVSAVRRWVIDCRSDLTCAERSYPASLLSCFCIHRVSIHYWWDLIRNGLSPFSLKPDLNCYRCFPYHPCSHVLSTACIAIKVCISFYHHKITFLPFPQAMESCRWVCRCDSCGSTSTPVPGWAGRCGQTLWTQEIGGWGKPAPCSLAGWVCWLCVCLAEAIPCGIIVKGWARRKDCFHLIKGTSRLSHCCLSPACVRILLI